VLCFYEPPPGEPEQAGTQDPSGEAGSDPEVDKDGPSFVVKLGKTVLCSSEDGEGQGEGRGSGGLKAVALDFGEVAVGQVARASIRIANHRLAFLDYAVHCSFATIANGR
jgi:hypothetical protein